MEPCATSSPKSRPLYISLMTAVKDGKQMPPALPRLPCCRAPTVIAMKYKGRIYSPLVIEAISAPGFANRRAGDYVEMAISMTLCTLAAIDRGDWVGMRQW